MTKASLAKSGFPERLDLVHCRYQEDYYPGYLDCYRCLGHFHLEHLEHLRYQVHLECCLDYLGPQIG